MPEHAYLPVFEIEPLNTGQTYQRLPLHCTLVHWFMADVDFDAIEPLLRQALHGVQPFVLQSGAAKKFGRNFDVPVNVIDPADEPRRIHGLVLDKLAPLAITFSAPDFVGEGYNPHVTMNGQSSFPAGSEFLCHSVCLVESTSPDYANSDRIIRAKVSLS